MWASWPCGRLWSLIALATTSGLGFPTELPNEDRESLPRAGQTGLAVFSHLHGIGLVLLASETPKGPVLLRFPADALDALFPKLFPET